MAPVEVWLVDLSSAWAALETIEAATPRLSPDVLDKLALMAEDVSRHERRAAHIALRLLIERAFGAATRGLAFEIGDRGKLALAVPGDFSLSHIPGFALIATCKTKPVGVDLERDRPMQMSADRRRAIEDAADALCPEAALPVEPAARTLQAWVRLEAIGKAEGSGIGAMLSRLGVTRAKINTASVGARWEELTSDLAVYDLDLGLSLYGAIALARGQPRPDVRHFPQSVEELAALCGD